MPKQLKQVKHKNNSNDLNETMVKICCCFFAIALKNKATSTLVGKGSQFAQPLEDSGSKDATNNHTIDFC